jgi:hypothetical protein
LRFFTHREERSRDLVDSGLAPVGLTLVAIAIGELLGLWIKRGRR